jgi:hypothetical protein
VALITQVWLSLFVTVRGYEPGARPAGKVATAPWSVNDTSGNAVWASVTAGARPDGLKFWPVTIIWLLDVLTTTL